MSEKKVVSRNAAIALGIICIFLVGGLAGVYLNYTSIISGKDSTISTLNSQLTSLQSQLASNRTLVSSLNSQISALQTWLNGNKTLLSQTQIWLNGNKTLLSQTQSQVNSLIAQVNVLQAPKLISVNGHYTSETNDIHIIGEICNVGTNNAYNPKLHLVGYQNGAVISEAHIIIASGQPIPGESWITVDTHYYYTNAQTLSWTITPEWTAS
jgi:hypothetical protein